MYELSRSGVVSAKKPVALSNPGQSVLITKPEVLAKPMQRRFTAEYTLCILQEKKSTPSIDCLYFPSPPLGERVRVKGNVI